MLLESMDPPTSVRTRQKTARAKQCRKYWETRIKLHHQELHERKQELRRSPRKTARGHRNVHSLVRPRPPQQERHSQESEHDKNKGEKQVHGGGRHILPVSQCQQTLCVLIDKRDPSISPLAHDATTGSEVVRKMRYLRTRHLSELTRAKITHLAHHFASIQRNSVRQEIKVASEVHPAALRRPCVWMWSQGVAAWPPLNRRTRLRSTHPVQREARHEQRCCSDASSFDMLSNNRRLTDRECLRKPSRTGAGSVKLVEMAKLSFSTRLSLSLKRQVP